MAAGQSLHDQLVARVIKPNHEKQTQRFPLSSFLPLDAIDETITSDLVASQLSLFTRIFKPNVASQFSPRIVERARRTFAILGLCRREAFIWDLFNEGFTDEHLPLARVQAEGLSNISNVLISPRGKRFECFLKLEREVVDNFLERQWQTLAPAFTIQGEHLDVNGGAPLPFYGIKKVPSSSLGSTVYRGMLHAAHLSFEMAKSKSDIEIAIKDYQFEDDFWKEKKNLEEIQSLKHPHLIWHIATIQKGDLFCAILPWADGGNLSDVWKKYPNALPTRNRKVFMWAVRQMLGLVDALFALHNVNCRHGDLKPDNILHFQAAVGPSPEHIPDGKLVITDVGVSRVHHQATELRVDPTNTKATTPCYEAPEAEFSKGAPRGRRYDMWSVGCVFMELVIWLLYGEKAINKFRELRILDDGRFPTRGAYYKCPTNDLAIIHPIVSQGFEELRNDPRCGEDTGLADLVGLISDDLIVIEPENRIKAEVLKERFETIVEKAEREPDYLIRWTEPPPRNPNMFMLGG
ncbi:kinase-like protein [Nemania sp. FL0031]|nr:kinase-like protein [Nemania sp. FL0031]